MAKTVYNAVPTKVQTTKVLTTYAQEKFHSLRLMDDACWNAFHGALMMYDPADRKKAEEANEEIIKISNTAIHTYRDWHLIPTSRPVIEPPEVKTHIVDIPGANGALDLSEALAGRVLYGNRSGSIEFAVVNGYWDSWVDAYSTMLGYVHGRHLYMILEDEPEYVYDGRFALGEWKSGADYSTVTFEYNLYPFKRDLTSSLEPWLWDPFNFVSPIRETEPDGTYINTNNNLSIDTSSASEWVIAEIEGGAEAVSPYFVTGRLDAGKEIELKVVFEGNEYKFNANVGTQSFPEIIFKEGINRLSFQGHAKVGIGYTRGYL